MASSTTDVPAAPTGPVDDDPPPVDPTPALVDEDDGPHRRWFQPPSAVQAIAMVVALLFVGGSLGWLYSSQSSVDNDHTEVDVGFLQDMIVHHEQALDMSYEAIARADNDSVRGFAEEIAFFQAREIGIMQWLLQEWGYDLDERPDTSMGWMETPVPLPAMPGLASDEQMAALRAASGSELDQQFLELMIHHHQGGVHMADYARTQAGDARVRALAEAMARNQTNEIKEYRLLEEHLGFPVTEP